MQQAATIAFRKARLQSGSKRYQHLLLEEAPPDLPAVDLTFLMVDLVGEVKPATVTVLFNMHLLAINR